MSEPTRARPRRPGRCYRAVMGFLGLFDRWLHLSCRAFIRLASEKHERPLTLGERRRQTVHRLMCGICRLQERRMEQLLTLAHDVAHHSGEDSRAELSPESIERMRRAMAKAPGKEPGGSD